MARSATTTDVFNAIAEPRRRRIVDLLGRSEWWSVGALVDELGQAQPSVSKHLGVLRKVGLVTVMRKGRSRLYRLNPKELKAVHDWAGTFERFWTHQLDRVKQLAESDATLSEENPATENLP